MLIHLIDGTQEDVAGAYKTIRGELAAYDEALAEKPEIVVLNKIDALTPDDIKAKAKALKKASKAEIMQISGATHQGVDDVLFAIIRVLDEAKAERLERARVKTQTAWAP